MIRALLLHHWPPLIAVTFGVAAWLSWSAPWWADAAISLLAWTTLDRIRKAGPPP